MSHRSSPQKCRVYRKMLFLTYLEPYASSASELVSEIVQYFDEKLELKPLEADALLAGITMDTKVLPLRQECVPLRLLPI